MNWPKAITVWHDGRIGYMSIPFTWLLAKAKTMIRQKDFFVDRWVVGGPAVCLMPDYLQDTEATIGGFRGGVLQRINPDATRTTTGCIRNCAFCGVRTIEGAFRELPEWPDRPILCDSNLLAASRSHFDRVIDRLIKHGWADFNQGLDARLLINYHAERIAEIKKPIVRLALDRDHERTIWADAIDRLRTAGIAKKQIRSFVLCGFDDGPEEAWERCRFVEQRGIDPSPMWFHDLTALQLNSVTERQSSLGWDKRKQRKLMSWYYFHRTISVRG